MCKLTRRTPTELSGNFHRTITTNGSLNARFIPDPGFNLDTPSRRARCFTRDLETYADLFLRDFDAASPGNVGIFKTEQHIMHTNTSWLPSDLHAQSPLEMLIAPDISTSFPAPGITLMIATRLASRNICHAAWILWMSRSFTVMARSHASFVDSSCEAKRVHHTSRAYMRHHVPNYYIIWRMNVGGKKNTIRNLVMGLFVLAWLLHGGKEEIFLVTWEFLTNHLMMARPAVHCTIIWEFVALGICEHNSYD